MNIQQAKYIAHSLGIRLIESVLSHKQKDKTLPKEFYRNYYNTRDSELLKDLVSEGLMENFNTEYYRVTPLGIVEFKKFFYVLVNYQPKKNRDETYLRHRINAYCSLYSYRFGENNSDHILSSYENYTLKGFYTSHTTTDVIKRFRNELNQNYKKKQASKSSEEETND